MRAAEAMMNSFRNELETHVTTTAEMNVTATIRELIRELAPNQTIAELKPEHRLVDDLEYHSLAFMELAFTLEDEFALGTLREEDIQKIVTAGDVERYVLSELNRKAASPEAVGA
jgi:acyl carrier protein